MIVHRIESQHNLRENRVAAYARVSTEQEEQQESFETQVSYYTDFIKQNPEWEFVKVYTDHGRSGTSASKRPGFQQMITDAKAGKMDIILVKSISRFARNVADAQRYVHELKDCEVEVRFEREALSSFDPSADLIFNVLAAVAQEESRSISENVKWAYRKNAEKGVCRLGNNRALGYDMDQSGKLIPNGDAWIIRQIFTDYMNGLSLTKIVKHINESDAKRLRSDKPFNVSAVLTLLSNELYVGDRHLQKQAPSNYLTKQPDPTASYTSYYITGAHEPIIDREIWERAKARLEEQRSKKTQGVHARETAHFLYGRLFCADCSAPYKRRTITGHDGTFKAWNCAERQKGKTGNGCKNVIIREDELLKAISDQLGWAVDDEKYFDAELLANTVQRVRISTVGLKVEKMEAM